MDPDVVEWYERYPSGASAPSEDTRRLCPSILFCHINIDLISVLGWRGRGWLEISSF